MTSQPPLRNILPFLSLCLLMILGTAASVAAQEKGPERWEETIRKFEMKDKEMKPEPGAILFVGSSSIAKWQDVGEYFPEARVINRGFGGTQFEDVIYYADRVIYPYQPSKIFIYEGDNDIGTGDSPKSVLKEAKKLRKMIAKNLGKEVSVIFISHKPSVARWNLKEKYEEANALLKKYADKKPYTEFADVWTPALDENGMVFKHIFVQDNLHMNADGYKIWQKVLKPYVEM
jgi:lysophospholipase L1-like esterase